MENRRNYYRILHVQPDAPPEVIKAIYRTLMQRLRMHPDLGGDSANAALINEAFAVLDDPAARAAYDRNRQRSIDDRAARRRAGASHRPHAVAALDERPAGDRPCACAFCGTMHSARTAARLRAACVECGSPLHPAIKMSPDGARRALPREPRRMPVSYCLSWPALGLFTGTTEDLSIAGMRLSTDRELAVNARLRIDCEFCSAVGIVRSCRLASPASARQVAQWMVGVEFLTVAAKRPRGSFVSTDA